MVITRDDRLTRNDVFGDHLSSLVAMDGSPSKESCKEMMDAEVSKRQ